ncbi:MAG: iron ABC transporter substrate-binding protein [Anaerolineae bacterium]|nr:iron ABC transporter substrate-binding protein [Anaerolineae bacterium]
MRRLIILALLALSVLLMACQPQTETVEVTRVVTETEEVEVTRVVTETVVETVVETATELVEVTRVVEVPAEAEVADPGTLIIYSGRSESLVQPIIDQFAAATGIDVQVRYGSTSEMAGVLLEEGANSPADIFYAQDPGGLGAVQQAGLLQPLPAEIVAQVSPRFVAEDGSWTGISGRARVVVYNTNTITDPATQLPDDLWGFTDPAWNGRIGWAPSNGSFQAMVTAMRAVWGEEQTREWLQGIQANNPRVFEGNTPIVEAVANGEVAVGFVNHYYLYRFLNEQGEAFAARNYFLPSGGPGSLLMVSGAGILAGADNGANAERFIAFLLSAPGQQYFSAQTFEYPVIEGVRSEATPSLAELDELALDISLTDLADLEGTQDMLIDLGIIE